MSRVMCWRLKLAKYEYEIVYKAGKINLNVEKRGGRINCGKNLQKPTVKLLFPFALKIQTRHPLWLRPQKLFRLDKAMTFQKTQLPSCVTKS